MNQQNFVVFENVSQKCNESDLRICHKVQRWTTILQLMLLSLYLKMQHFFRACWQISNGATQNQSVCNIEMKTKFFSRRLTTTLIDTKTKAIKNNKGLLRKNFKTVFLSTLPVK